ncbi:Protein of unknown function Smg [hydrothermal vent metagenome]|uniref:Protein Smg homolog n=1 Tax=hydrothermal vent metagenome TaxID=652676 RepID=A0A3B0YZ90_9ZZZZ
MKENALDVLMYLFKNYIDGELEYVPDRESLETELVEAGFPDHQINQAFNWLDELASGQPPTTDSFPQNNSIRIYTVEEMQLLDLECRGFLHFLEQSKVISPEIREVIIDRVLALEGSEIDIDRLKWIIVMIMFNLPEHDSNYEWLENIVFENSPENLH